MPMHPPYNPDVHGLLEELGDLVQCFNAEHWPDIQACFDQSVELKKINNIMDPFVSGKAKVGEYLTLLFDCNPRAQLKILSSNPTIVSYPSQTTGEITGLAKWKDHDQNQDGAITYDFCFKYDNGNKLWMLTLIYGSPD